MGCSEVVHLMRSLYLKKIPIVPSLLRRSIRLVFACEVMPTCDIDKTVELYHGGLGCVFHENVVVDEGVKIYQNVTLGGNGKPCEKGKNHPHLKKNCIIYAGACVLGPITVGENSIVGANAVVLNDVPANSIAVGVPAVIKPRR